MARVAFVLKKFPKSSETFISNQIRGLTESGHDVDIYAQYRGDGEADSDESLGAEYANNVTYFRDIGILDEVESLVRVQSLELLSRPQHVKRLLRHGTGAVSQKNLWRRRAGPLSDKLDRYDAVHAHYGPIGNGFLFLASLTDAPFATSFYGYDASELLDKNPWRYEGLFAEASRITSLSSQMDERLAAHGCPESKLDRLPLPVDVSSFEFSPTRADDVDEIELLSVCRLVEKKGLRYVLEAVSRLRDTYDINYRIAGDGPLRDELEERARELGVRDIVTFVGWQSSAEVAGLMEESHIFVQPSVTSSEGDKEGTPTVLLEAQARGMPVVSTHHAGIHEIVDDGSSGLLVPERDIDALEAALDDLFADPASWEEFGRNGRQLVEDRHAVPQVAKTLERIYWE